MVGGGVQLPPLQDQARKLGVAERVIFTGEVDHSEIAEYQAALDIYVASSLSEGQPMAYTEALAAATPLVALRAPGATDIVDHGVNGLLVAPDDGVKGMADALAGLVEDEPRRLRLSQGARLSAEAFEPEAIAKRLTSVYEMAALRRATEHPADDL